MNAAGGKSPLVPGLVNENGDKLSDIRSGQFTHLSGRVRNNF
jgi:hypothetical protein